MIDSHLRTRQPPTSNESADTPRSSNHSIRWLADALGCAASPTPRVTQRQGLALKDYRVGGLKLHSQTPGPFALNTGTRNPRACPSRASLSWTCAATSGALMIYLLRVFMTRMCDPDRRRWCNWKQFNDEAYWDVAGLPHLDLAIERSKLQHLVHLRRRVRVAEADGLAECEA
ncbi:hypothetical protein BDV95DRAFT_561991 [Massariosphaeria phaeospora]|uniref:Uncharacterized protein n=1 Tax=Massariosphaeria phaeospora TaxID=100035 RepID=A0A7C8IDV5_9PLEO|nr:hypothetical protein BDV95DRAFT_561991 [Massariosphaeria phaeospora]